MSKLELERILDNNNWYQEDQTDWESGTPDAILLWDNAEFPHFDIAQKELQELQEGIKEAVDIIDWARTLVWALSSVGKSPKYSAEELEKWLVRFGEK